MPGEKPGSNSRGRGGKFRNYTRGGGKHYSRNLRPVDSDGNEISMWSEDAQKQFAESDPEGSSDDDSEGTDDAGQGNAVSREDRKKEKKARKEAAAAKKMTKAVEVGDLPPSDSEEEDSDDDDDDDDDAPVNPNHSRAARSQAAMTGPVEAAADGVKKLTVTNRRERESLEALQAKERYRKLHEAGKTDEAKADLARLKLIREQREAEAARRQAEKEEREAQEAARRAEIDAKEAKKREAALGPKKGKKATK